MSGIRVMKFGGTSVGSAERLRGVAALATSALAERRVAVVVSAVAGVTDLLVAALAAARLGAAAEATGTAKRFRILHEELLAGLAPELSGEAASRASAELEQIAAELEERLRGVAILRDSTPRVEAAIVTAGERATSALLFELFAASGHEAVQVDPTETLPCTGDPLEATPMPDEMAARLEAMRSAAGPKLLVMPGFYGGDAKRQVMCLGRGGSDYSAALLAQALGASELEIWTDVDGVYSTDPRIAPAARLLERLSFEEALELAHFGAKVLHPKTIAPARAAGIPVLIRNSFHPGRPGTRVERVDPELAAGRIACGISYLRGVALVTLAGPGMPGLPGVAARLFAALAQHGISVILITQGSSETAISFAVPESRADESAAALRAAFDADLAIGRVEEPTLRRNLAVVSLVGDGMRERVGVAASFFGALGESRVNVAAIAQGASERSISAVVGTGDGESAVRALHRRFFENDVGDRAAARRASNSAARAPERAVAFAPAGVGNFAAGFDVLGAAVAPVDGELWGDRVEVKPGAGRDRLTCDGPFAHRLPERAEENLVFRARDAFARRFGAPLPPLEFALHKGLPVASGLGSSASSVAATLVALNAAFGDPLDGEALLAAAGEAEAAASGAVHLDNVAPILFGGLLLVGPEGGVRALPFPGDLRIVLFVPELELTTRGARTVLPREVGLGAAVGWGQNLAALVQALYIDDRALLRSALRDPLAEPHRAALVAGFREVQRAALEAGALGGSFSGAGPSIFAVAEESAAESIAAAGVATWRAAGVRSTARVCRLDTAGARRVD